MKKVTRRYVTLIEMMIVMFLIALITGVVAYNYRATLEKGRLFKTEQGMEKLETVLLLKVAEDPNAWNDLETQWRVYVEGSPLVHKPKDLFKDGWGYDYKITVDRASGSIEIMSEGYENYLKNQSK